MLKSINGQLSKLVSFDTTIIEFFSMCSFLVWGMSVLNPVQDACSYVALESVPALATELGLFMFLTAVYQFCGLYVNMKGGSYLVGAIMLALLVASVEIFIRDSIFSVFGYIYLTLAVIQAASFYFNFYYKASVAVISALWMTIGIILVVGGSFVYGVVTVMLGLYHVFILATKRNAIGA